MAVGLGLFLAVFAAKPATAWADGRRDLEDGIAFYEALDTDRAQARLKAASRAWDLGPSQRSRAFVYLGMLAFELGRSRAAVRAWQAAVTLDANQAPPTNSSPKILRAFERVRRTLPNPPPPVPRQNPPPQRAVRSSPPPPPSPPPPSVKRVPAAPPKVVPPPPPDPWVPAPTVAREEEDDEGTSPWVWVAVGGGVAAVAAGIVVAVLATSGGDDSECSQGGGGCVFVRLR